MPFYRKRRAFKRKGYYGRSRKFRRQFRKYKKGPTRTIIRGPAIVPDKYLVKLRYTDTINITSTAGAQGLYQFRGNSLFDPDLTSTGSQPVGFDELTALYLRYLVYGSKIVIKITSVATTAATQAWDIVLIPTIESTIAPTNDALAGNPYSRRTVRNLVNGSYPITLKYYMASSKMFGTPKRAISIERDYSASYAANPTKQWYWSISGNTADTSSTAQCIVVVDITYYACFYDRNDLTSS